MKEKKPGDPKYITPNKIKQLKNMRVIMEKKWIIPNKLAASGTPTSNKDIQDLHKWGIKAIVTVTEFSLMERGFIEKEILTKLNIEYLHLDIADDYGPTHDQAKRFIQFTKRMEDEQRPLLIHCMGGIGRTGTFLLLYFISHGYSLVEAEAKINRISPNNLLISDAQRNSLISFVQNLED
ncbi:protein-tyrosine phosphatase family protein [Candidatus Hodarchaeum mangrovi]